MRYGHSWRDLPSYTIPQIKLFFREVEALECLERASRVEDTAIGAQSTGDSITKTIASLRSGGG